MSDKYSELISTGLIDEPIFSQNLEMDDDPVVRDFSFDLVNDYFLQAQEKFGEMDAAVRAGDVDKLKDIGHFLKGSSSGIGLNQLQETFGRIDNIGKGLTESGAPSSDSKDVRLRRIAALIKTAKEQFNNVSAPLRRFYGDDRFEEEVRRPIPLDPQ